MAGIGFKLRGWVEKGTFAGFLQGYLYAAIIAAGPWLISIVTLATIQVLTRETESLLFPTGIVYVYCFTLLFVGPFQFTVTRYVSDRLYLGDTGSHIPAFFTTWCLSVPPQVLLFYGFLAFLEAPLLFRVALGSLYAIVASTWVVLIFLGAVRAYRVVIASFVVGCAASVAVSLVVRSTGLALEGTAEDALLMGSFSIGQAVVLGMLLWVLLSEFDITAWWAPEVPRYLKRYGWLTATGFCYYAGMWADKLMYGFSSQGVVVARPFFNSCPTYELAVFLAQLTAIPALAIFFLRVETEFFDRLRAYFVALQDKRSLGEIEQAYDAMLGNLRSGGLNLVATQAVMSLCFIFAAPEVFPHLGATTGVLAMFRIQVVGVLLQTLMFMVSIVLMYFELHREACVTTGLFMALNLLLTALLLPLGPAWNGVGYLAAGVVAGATGLFLLVHHLSRLTFATFARQPLSNLVALPPERCNTAEGIGEFTFVRQRS